MPHHHTATNFAIMLSISHIKCVRKAFLVRTCSSCYCRFFRDFSRSKRCTGDACIVHLLPCRRHESALSTRSTKPQSRSPQRDARSANTPPGSTYLLRYTTVRAESFELVPRQVRARIDACYKPKTVLADSAPQPECCRTTPDYHLREILSLNPQVTELFSWECTFRRSLGHQPDNLFVSSAICLRKK